MAKIIGRHKSVSPEDALRKLERLNREMEELRPYSRPRSVVFKFKSWHELYEFTITRASRKI